MKPQIVILMIAMFIAPWIAETSFAQVQQADIGVDGLACPFCSYGLEKKLKEAKGADEVTINISKGLAVLKSNGKESLEVEQFEPIIKDAGFTLRSLTVTAVGTISQSNDSPMLFVNGTDTKFILKNNTAYENLRTKLSGTDKLIRITGTLSQEMPQGHHAHPFTLTIEESKIQ